MHDQIIIVFGILFSGSIGVIFYRYLEYGIHLNYKNYHIVEFADGTYALTKGFIFKEYLSPKNNIWMSTGWIEKTNKFLYITCDLDTARELLNDLMKELNNEKTS